MDAGDGSPDRRAWTDLPQLVRPEPPVLPGTGSFLTGQYSHNHQVLSHEEPYGFGSFDDRDTLATRLSDGAAIGRR